MSTDIRTTVQTVLSQRGLGSYMRDAEPVIEALLERERGIYNDLLTSGTSLGASPQQVTDVLNAAGVTSPVPHVVAANGGSMSAASSLSGDQIDELSSIRHDASGLVERIDRLLG